MKKIRSYARHHQRFLLFAVSGIVAVGFLLLYRLGSLVDGLSAKEYATSITPVGWHGIYHQPFYLPLELVRSAVFFIPHHFGQTLTRLPNAVFGGLTIVIFAAVLRLWHGARTAVLATSLFATSAWVLHVSRLASFDVLYLLTIPALLLVYVALQRREVRAVTFYGSMLIWGALLYTPGVIWLILYSVYVQRKAFKSGWQHFAAWWQRLLYLLAGLIWLPLLITHLTRPGALKTWLGLPPHLAAPLTLLKHFAAVFVHLFIRGPQYPDLWLGRAPLLDIFTLAVCLLGIYFYARNWRAARSRLLGGFFLIGAVLVGLGGPVSLSLLVPLLYLAAATGIAYLLRDWLKVFPLNPLARSLGIGL
ncbi:MAG: hypothetical protein WA843_01950, partial [Candidatus Saccharimonadales bacterium]